LPSVIGSIGWPKRGTSAFLAHSRCLLGKEGHTGDRQIGWF
jgi:hypothetical protein